MKLRNKATNEPSFENNIRHELEHQSFMDNPPVEGQLPDSLPIFVIHTSLNYLYIPIYKFLVRGYVPT